MTTKPYVSGAAYINRMSDYCRVCAFDAKRNCPITNLYWSFLDRHRECLSDNSRMRVVLNALRRRSDDQLADDRSVYRWVGATLDRGERLYPADRPNPAEPAAEDS